MAGVAVIFVISFFFSRNNSYEQQNSSVVVEPDFVQNITTLQQTGIDFTPIVISSENITQIEESLENQGFVASTGEYLSGELTGKNSSSKELSQSKTFIGNKTISLAKNKKLPVSVILTSKNKLNNKVAEVEIPAGISVKTKNNNSYTKEIQEPKFIDPKKYNLDNKSAVSMIKVGSDEESLFFKNIQGQDQYVTIRMPAPGYEVGSDVNIYSSEDGKDWKFHIQTKVQDIGNSPYVVFITNHFTLFTVGSIQWDNDNFLTDEFWNNNPTDAQIIRALYGDGSGGTEKTAYTKYWSGITCVTGNMSVVYLSGGTSKIPLNLNANTIYVLESGNYISTGYIRMTGCSAIIGKTGSITLFSSGYLSYTTGGLITSTTGNNIILDNFKLDGQSDGLGSSHTSNQNGLYFLSSNSNTFHTIGSYNNKIGMYFYTSNYNLLDSVNLYNNTSYGISCSYFSYNLITNSKLYNNGGGINGGYFGSNYVNNTQIYNNNGPGFRLANSSNNTFNNMQIYNNVSYGMGFSSASSNVVNNTQMYNNNGWGIWMERNPLVLNNVQIYNNSQGGIYFWNSSNHKLNNVTVYNNPSGIYFFGTSTGSKYYGKLKLYENDIDIDGNTGSISKGLESDYNYLGRTGGYIDYSPCFRCANITNPINIGSGVLTNTGMYWTCNSRGKISGWTPSMNESINYIYGTNMLKQGSPVQYSGANLSGSSLSYSGNLYIGEINKISENNDIACINCSGSDYSATWDNANYITSGFWSQNPKSCDIVAALYGTGIYGEDQTAYTINWSGAQFGNLCDKENMRVFTGSPGTEILPSQLPANTIYILDSGNYITPWTINTQKCSAIIVKNGKGSFYSTGALSNGLFYVYQKNNNIFENITIDGTGNGYGASHNRNEFGIFLGYSINNLFNNVQTYNNNQFGFYLNGSNNALIDSKSYNNSQYGIFSYGYVNVLHNIQTYNNNIGINVQYSSSGSLNNVQSYNNNSYGIYLQYGSNNTVNNTLSYNNNGYGIYLDSSSNNVLNNVQSYNNLVQGLYFNNSSNNILNQTSLLNNSTGIYIGGTSTGNKYYGKLKLYENDIDRDGNISGILKGNQSDYSILGWTGGYLDYAACFRCANIINPVNMNSGMLTNTGIYRACNSRGKIIGWAPSIAENIGYIYGINVPRQILPVQYVGITLTGSNLTYSGNLYIGEINKIGEYSDAICNDCSSKYSINWNNDNFLNSGFWSQNPNSCDIVLALYGTGIYGEDKTAYTKNRAGSQNGNFCDIENMRVFTGSSGTGILPSQLPSNTIYILNSGTYINTGTINTNNCNAIVTKDGPGMLYSTIQLTNGLYIYGKRNNIIENVYIDGNGNGFGGSHGLNNYGIFLSQSYNNILNSTQTYNNGVCGIVLTLTSNSNILSNIKSYNSQNGIQLNASNYNVLSGINVYNNSSNGIHLTNGSNYNTIKNIQAYKNSVGIYLWNGNNYNLIYNIELYNNYYQGLQLFYASNYNTIIGAKIFNNNTDGIYFYDALGELLKGNIIENSLIFNNGTNGINFSDYNSGNILQNVVVYNNSGYGVYFTNGSGIRNNILNNLYIYNNTSGIYLPGLVTGNYIYNNLNIFGNKSIIEGTGNLLFGSGETYSYLGRTTGEIITGGTMSRDVLVNPRNASGNYLLPWTGTWSGMIGNRTFTGTENIQTSYGYNISRQTQPIIYSGSTLILGGDYDTGKYIGGNVTAFSGSLSGLVDSGWNTTIDVAVLADMSLGYNVFGNLQQLYTGTTNTPTSITLSAGTGTKTVVTQLYDANNFATHLVRTTLLKDFVDTELPVVQTGYIVSGMTGENNGNIYYKGPITIRSYVSDNDKINTGSCMYSLMGLWYTASGYTTYCEKLNITPNQDINLVFNVRDVYGNTGYGITGIYLFDGQGPTPSSLISPINNQVYTQPNISLQWNDFVDTGIGVSGYIYQISSSEEFLSLIKTGTIYGTSVLLSSLGDGQYYWRVAGFDIFGNISSWSSSEIFTVDSTYVNIPSATNTNAVVTELLSGGYEESTGSLEGNTGYFVGTKRIRVHDSSGTLLVPIIMQSSGLSIIELEMNSGIVLKTHDGIPYTGIIELPVEKDKSMSSLLNTLTVVSLGSSTTSLQIKDKNNNLIPVVVRVPVLGISLGSGVKIYYSENNGTTWNLHGTGTVTDINGNSYVEFTTTHFTDFAVTIGGETSTGSFVINNNDSSTSLQEVILNIVATGIARMQFSNDNTSRSLWENYTGTKLWTLTSGAGNKIVYVRFDIEGDDIADIFTSDNIFLIESTNGNITLEILPAGPSECIYGTSLNLGAQDAKINLGYTFTGMFSGDWYCADNKGVSVGRAFTIHTTDLTGNNGGVISGSNVLISHSPAFVQGEGCTGYSGEPTEFYGIGFTLMEKLTGYNNICKVTISDVALEIEVPSNQTPGDYQGILTIDIPNFN